MITGISHITLAISDLGRSLQFYTEVLGFELVMRSDHAAYFSAGELWFCVVVDPLLSPEPRSDYTHIAFALQEADFPLAAERVLASGARVFKGNESEGESLYFLDPDGHKLEIHCGTLQSRLDAIQRSPRDNAKVLSSS